MADFGFWAMAQEEPGHLALVGPDGTELKAGELLGRANQVVHGLRALGLRPGDTIAFVLPNGIEVFEIYLAALQAGWYIVPINHHLVAPRSPTSSRTRRPRSSSATSASPTLPGRGRGGRDPRPRLLGRRGHPRVRLLRRDARQPEDRPARATAAWATR